MRKNLCNNVLRTSAFALACLAFVGADANAAAMLQNYSTSDTILSSGITGDTSAISFNPVTSGSFAGSSSIGLGAFVINALPDGTSTTYNDTPFSITYQPKDGSGGLMGSPVTITGTLNGTVTGSDQSSVVATFTPTPAGQFTTFTALDSPLHLVPSSAGVGTTVQAQFVPTDAVPAPEPTTLAILATSLVGFGLRQKLRSGRKSA